MFGRINCLRQPMYKILFVCAGNICRSPTAEGIMRRLIEETNMEKTIEVDSAGISAYHQGDAPDSRSVICALEHGIDIRDLRSRPLSAEDFAKFDLILAMDENNLEDICYRRPNGDKRYEKAKVKRILEYAPEYGQNVPDPYYHNGFDRVFEMLEAACQNLLTTLSNSQNKEQK